MVSISKEERNKRRRQRYATVVRKRKQDAQQHDQIRQRLEQNERSSSRMRKSRESQTQSITLDRVFDLEQNLTPPLSTKATVEATLRFEHACEDVNHTLCVCCRRVKLNMNLNKNNICMDCAKFKDVRYYEDRKLLPIWYKDGQAQYHVPSELLCLTLAEKMLIALASPFIPLRHIKNGVFGLSGHVCCFEQDLEIFVNTLPRHPTDVTVLKVLKEMPVEIGSAVTRISAYTVRRSKVGDALAWLKEYNVEYKHIQIDMTALDWLQGEEGSLDAFVLPSDQEMETEDFNDINSDLGPSPSMTKGVLQAGDNVKAFGFIDESPGDVLSPDDAQIHNEVVGEIDASSRKQNIHVQWPAHGPIAINEYSSTRIFVRAFPWLFPGGLGDAKDVADGDLQKWGERLLYYEDGRFATDKYFSFYALNYITRHRNAKSGQWFIKGFNKNGPQNLEELKQSIRHGNVEFVNRLMYFNKHVRGSTSYWHQKRAEVYSWINHHVEAGHGPPNLFITLSCAEYYWPDVLRLITERMRIAGDARSEDCYQGSPKLTEILNDYTVVVQEFFQIRFDLWMEHVGRPIFGIAHFWARYEFAPGRGQIHIHLLAIRKDQNIFRLCYEDLQTPDGKEKRDIRLAAWAWDQFGLTASVDSDFQNRSALPQDSPCSIRLSDLTSLTDPPDATIDVLRNDQQNLIRFCQVHDCNGFCLRQKGNKRHRICRCGAGSEVTPGEGDTPGFPLSKAPVVVHGHKRCQELRMPRNHPRINQTSISLIQSWRGNCDVQILVYESHPDNFDLREVSKVTDYVVAYSTKASTTYREEVHINCQLILGMEETTGDLSELKTLCKHISNRASASRLISKPEAAVLLGCHDLIVCSEYIDSVSISNNLRISVSGQHSANKSLLVQYAKRSPMLENLSLHDFYPLFRSTVQGKKPYVPHYIGVKGHPTFPVSQGYARHVLIVYKPWRTYPELLHWKSEFDRFIHSAQCPKSAKLTYKRVLQRFYDGTKFVEPTSAHPTTGGCSISEVDEETLLLAGLGRLPANAMDPVDLNSVKKGIAFLWGKPSLERTLSTVYDGEPSDWLRAATVGYESSIEDSLVIPMNHEGNPFVPEALYPEQQQTLYPIVDKIREWMTCDDLSKFETACFTVCGKGGTGKTILLNTLTAVLRQLFGYNNVVATTGPTGSSAFNAFGETLHRFAGLGIRGEYKPNTLKLASQERLRARCKHLLCLIIDERSLLSSQLLGSTAQVISEVIFDGAKRKEMLGGLPVLILAGDDYQLPGMQEGAFQALTKHGGSRMTQKGRTVLLRCAENVLQLQTIRRVGDSQQRDKEMVERIRLGVGVLDQDVERLQSLHLHKIGQRHGQDVVKQIEKEAVYIFWTNEKRVQRNLAQLLELNTDENPTAIIKPKGQGSKYGKSINAHFDTDTPSASLLCIGAKVCLNGPNLYPSWGLHTGACGIVQEIVFEKGHNPNNGDHPKYVVVHFPQYIGPPWDIDKPKDIPIPIVRVSCTFKCCQRSFLPLELAFARTLHRFQGQSAGPVDKGKIKNATPVIICDPDVRQAEGRATGFFYTLISRATTFGDETGLNSAIYFTGPNLTKDRIQNLTVKTNSNTTLINVQRRNAWVQHLENHLITSKATEQQMDDLFAWTKTPIPYDALYKRTQQYIACNLH